MSAAHHRTDPTQASDTIAAEPAIRQHHQQQPHPCKKSICLFGLSADPPTGYGGHVGIVQTLQQQNQWDEIWVIPVYRHTFNVCM